MSFFSPTWKDRMRYQDDVLLDEPLQHSLLNNWDWRYFIDIKRRFVKISGTVVDNSSDVKGILF